MLEESNLGRLIEEEAAKYPGRVALIYEGREVSFRQLNENINRLANGLRSLGITRGDRVAIMLPNIPEFVYSFFALQKIGAIAVPFNTLYKGGEIIHILNDCQAKAIILLTNFVSLINEIKPEVPSLQYIITCGERTLTFAHPQATIFTQLICSKKEFSDLDKAYREIGEALIAAFKELGVKEVWYKHKGGLRVGGKKIGGFLFSELEDIYHVFIVSFLGPLRPEEFFPVIWVPPEVKDKIIEPITSIEEEIGRRLKKEEFKEAIIQALEKKLKIKLKAGELGRDELFAYEKYRALASKG